MKVDLGMLKVPFSGDYSHAWLLFGFGVAFAANLYALSSTAMVGPAAKASDLTSACRVSALVTCAWSLVYYNYIGCAIWCGLAAQHWYEMITGKDVGPQFAGVASRFSGNMAEQAPVFLTSLWMYTVFCDSATGGALGMLYILQRLSYPFFYMYDGHFTMHFEMCTQIGYGINGIMILGVLVTFLSGDWLAWVAATGMVKTTLYGVSLGVFMLFPGPIAVPFSYLNYISHKGHLKSGKHKKA